MAGQRRRRAHRLVAVGAGDDGWARRRVRRCRQRRRSRSGRLRGLHRVRRPAVVHARRRSCQRRPARGRRPGLADRGRPPGHRQRRGRVARPGGVRARRVDGGHAPGLALLHLRQRVLHRRGGRPLRHGHRRDRRRRRPDRRFRRRPALPARWPPPHPQPERRSRSATTPTTQTVDSSPAVGPFLAGGCHGHRRRHGRVLPRRLRHRRREGLRHRLRSGVVPDPRRRHHQQPRPGRRHREREPPGGRGHRHGLGGVGVGPRRRHGRHHLAAAGRRSRDRIGGGRRPVGRKLPGRPRPHHGGGGDPRRGLGGRVDGAQPRSGVPELAARHRRSRR